MARVRFWGEGSVLTGRVGITVRVNLEAHYADITAVTKRGDRVSCFIHSIESYQLAR